MTKRRRGTILVRYSAEAAVEVPPRPVARSRLQGRGAAADGAAARGPCPRRATSLRRPFDSSFRGRRPPLPSYFPVPRDLLRGNVPRDRSRGLRSRRRRPDRRESCSLASGARRSDPRGQTVSPPDETTMPPTPSSRLVSRPSRLSGPLLAAPSPPAIVSSPATDGRRCPEKKETEKNGTNKNKKNNPLVPSLPSPRTWKPQRTSWPFPTSSPSRRTMSPTSRQRANPSQQPSTCPRPTPSTTRPLPTSRPWPKLWLRPASYPPRAPQTFPTYSPSRRMRPPSRARGTQGRTARRRRRRTARRRRRQARRRRRRPAR